MNNVWDKVKLVTEDHGFVVSGKIPHFDHPPKVLLWGDRVFVYLEAQELFDLDLVHIYKEAFAVYLVRAD